MRKILIALAALALPLQPALAQADSPSQAEPELANLAWYRVVHVAFKNGKTDEALKLIETFVRNDDAIGVTRPMIMRTVTGEYDLIIVHPMREGIAAMGWEKSPHQERWNAALEKRLGGPEQMAAHWKKYYDVVEKRHDEIVFVDNDFAPAQ